METQWDTVSESGLLHTNTQRHTHIFPLGRQKCQDMHHTVSHRLEMEMVQCETGVLSL